MRMNHLSLSLCVSLALLPAAAPAADEAAGLVPTGTLLPFEESTAEEPLKLFQPAHQRFYLITAGLVCRLPGLPEKQLASGYGEQVSFVVRRLWPKAENPNPELWKKGRDHQERLVEALRKGDAEASRKIMTDHMEVAWALMQAQEAVVAQKFITD